MTSRADIRRVPFDDPDAVALRAAQVAYGNALYADDPASVHRSGSEGIDPDSVLATFVAWLGAAAVGTISVRRLVGEEFGDVDGDLELKRMYVDPDHRGHGIADDLLAAAEQVARDDGAPRIVIHTGDQQHAALRFYDRHGYTPIPVYPPYEAVTYSLCFEKVL